MKDAFGRDITYARLSVTDRCNLRCAYCMPEGGVEDIGHGRVLRNEEFVEIARSFAELGVSKFRVTGGEPLVRKGIVRLVGDIASIPGVRDLSMTTNAALLKDMAAPLKEAGLRRVNVSLDTLDEGKYRQITRGGSLSDALNGIEAAQKAGLGPIKLNCVLLKGFSEGEVRRLAELTLSYPLDVRFIECMPIGTMAEEARERFLPLSFVAAELGEMAKAPEDPHAAAQMYRLPGALGKVGLIAPLSSKFCSSCNRIRLTSDGMVKPCLHSDGEWPLRPFLGDGEALKRAIEGAVQMKPRQHRLLEGESIAREMPRIGG
jgi:cyclic pyranopterin phosphate synthase